MCTISCFPEITNMKEMNRAWMVVEQPCYQINGTKNISKF